MSKLIFVKNHPLNYTNYGVEFVLCLNDHICISNTLQINKYHTPSNIDIFFSPLTYNSSRIWQFEVQLIMQKVVTI